MNHVKNSLYQDRIVLITGTTKGIGFYLAKCFLEKQAIVCGFARSESFLRHERYYHYQGDVTNIEDVTRVLQEVRKKFRRLDILINNAGIASMNPCILMPETSAKKILDINMLGVFNMSRESVKLMMKEKYGRIINFSSVAVPMHIEGEAIYASSKAAIEEFSKIFAREVARYGITVNVIGPSPIMTDLIAKVPEEKIQNLVKQMPLSRLGEFRDVENVVDFFASEASDYITGQVIYLGGVS
ncbi:MAG: SDR family oxidoreductase [Fischerella sp.]|jgi:3-oxoacyl-[acyl-carrier protein] reductase|uniref:SDR family NAD(P)-dependent oxidoreductase n=1 Tax=Fischerella sp. TaxID=1191 RepID=UPI0017DB5533|nr:SDR family oxidoreductase [Fischerella sp.]NWF58832.1 SDR family oxidoreductase [Fischerella sp.]